MKYLRKFDSLSEYRTYIHNTGFTSLCMYTDGGNSVVANEIIVPHGEIWYTSIDGEIVEPSNPDAFGATILTNTYSNGKGVITLLASKHLLVVII